MFHSAKERPTMPKVITASKPTSAAPSHLGLSNRPYLTVLENDNALIKDLRDLKDTEKPIRLFLKTYSWGETLIRTFPKPTPDRTESRSKPPVNEGQRIQDGLSKRGKSRLTRAGRFYQNIYKRCNMITVGYGDTSLSDDVVSKGDLDRYLKSLRRYCQKEYGEFHYVWVAEIQEKRLLRDGIRVIHYHILTPHYIPKNIINKAWNNAVNKPREQKGLPTQTLYPQIISAYNAGAYIAKYCQKEGHLIKGNGYNMSQETSNSIKPNYQQCFDITAEHSYNIQMFESQYLTKNEETLGQVFEDGNWFKWFPKTNQYAIHELLKYSLNGNESIPLENQERPIERTIRSTEYVPIESTT